MLLTTHPFLVLRSWKSRATPLPTLWAKPGLKRDHFTLFKKKLITFRPKCKLSKQNQHPRENHTVITNTIFDTNTTQHKTKNKEHRKTPTEQATRSNTNTTSQSYVLHECKHNSATYISQKR